MRGKAKITDFLIVFLLAAMPLAVGTVHFIPVIVFALVSLGMFTQYFASGGYGRLAVFRSPFVIACSLFAFVPIAQLIPLPPELLKILSPASFSLYQEYVSAAGQTGRWHPISIYPWATFYECIKLIAYGMVVIVVISRARFDRDNTPVPHHPSYFRYVRLGLIGSLLSILLHSLVDFNLHIPANALYFSVILALAAAMHRVGRPHEGIPYNYPFIHRIVNSIIVTGFVIATLAILQRFSWNGRLLWFGYEGLYDSSGPFYNYDHFAGYMEMCLMLGAGCFLGNICRTSYSECKGFKDKILWFSSKEANTTLLYLFVTAVMAAGLAVSTSRGGVMSFLAAFFLFVVVVIVRLESGKKRLFAAAILLLCCLWVMCVWVGLDPLLNRFSLFRLWIKEDAVLQELRPLIWKDMMPMIRDFFVTGSGWGTFDRIFPLYRTFVQGGKYLRYAHSDYLQTIAEMGVFGIGFITAFFVFYIKMTFLAVKKLKNSSR